MDLPATLTCTLRARTGPHLARFVSAWQVRYHTKVIRFPGFVSADLMPPVNVSSNDWRLIVRFSNDDFLDRWMHSPEHAWLKAEAQELLDAHGFFQETVGNENEKSNSDSITEIIRSEIHPGMEDAYRAWAQKTQHIQSQFEGYRGVHVLAPIPGKTSEWTTLLRFDTEENLDRWRLSSERAALLEEARLVIEKTEITRLASSYPGWVPLNPNTGEGPPRWKTGLLVLIGLYPIVMLNVRFILPHMMPLSSSVANLASNLITVGATTYLTMPLLVQKFRWWLFPDPQKSSSQHSEWRGIRLILVIIAAEVAFFWLLR